MILDFHFSFPVYCLVLMVHAVL